MIVTRFQQEKGDKGCLQTPFVRFSTNGCGLEGCNCSPKRFLSFGLEAGKGGISIELTKEEANQIIASVSSGWLDLQIPI